MEQVIGAVISALVIGAVVVAYLMIKGILDDGQ
jgi:hypothetical protein